MPGDPGTSLVLLSGGLDSAATLALYHGRPSEATALFVDYGQPAAANEHRAAQELAKHYDTPLQVVRIAGLPTIGAGYVRGRNAFLLQAALAAAPFEVGQVAIGVHAGTEYADCSPAFLSAMQRCFDLYCAGRIQVVAPFVDQDKRSVIAFCREVELPMELTYSCERGTTPPCGACLSCLDRQAFHV